MAITQHTKAEDDKLRKALENADLKKFRGAMRKGFSTSPPKKPDHKAPVRPQSSP